MSSIRADITLARALLDKYRGASMRARLQRAPLVVTQFLTGPIAALSPVASGATQRSVKAWVPSGAAPLSAKVGPTSHQAHLAIRPHRIVTPGGRDTGRRTRGNPFVDAALQSSKDDAIKAATDVVFGP